MWLSMGGWRHARLAGYPPSPEHTYHCWFTRRLLSGSLCLLSVPPLPLQVLTNSYIKEVPAVAMTFKQKNAGVDSLQVGREGGRCCGCGRGCQTALHVG